MNPCSNKWNKRRRIVKSIRPPPFRKNTHHIPPKGLTAYGIHIALNGSRRPFIFYHISPPRSTAFTQGFPDGRSRRGLSPRPGPETRRAARSSPSSRSPILSCRRLQGNDAIPGRSHDLSACAGLPAPGCKSKPPADQVSPQDEASAWTRPAGGFRSFLHAERSAVL